MLGGKVSQEARQEFRRIAGIGFHNSYDRSDIDIVMRRVPAIEISDHGDRRVGNLRLAGELGFGHRGHADDIAAIGLIGERFGERRKLRAFDADIRPILDEGDLFGRRGGGDPLLQQGATGCAIETWATQPLPKNELCRESVLSMN